MPEKTVGNRINWHDAEAHLQPQNILNGDDEFQESVVTPLGDVTVKLPVDYQANAGYNVMPGA